MAATLNLANYGAGVYGTAKYGQYNVKPSGIAALTNLDARPSNDMRFVAFSDQIVRAIYAGTKVYVDGSLHATLTNVGDTTTVSIGNQSGNTRPSKIITADYPVSIAGNGNSLAAAPFSWSGTRFSWRDTRTNDSEIIVQAVRTETTVRIYKGTDTSPTYTLTAKTDEAAVAEDIFGTYGSQTWSIEADDLIVAAVGAGQGDTDSFSVDTDILFPESTELFGHGGTLTSTDARTNSTGFTVTTFRSELGTTETDTLSTSNQNPGVSGRSTQYSLGNYTRSTASTPFSLFTIADADGGETTIAVGPEALCTEWTLPDEAEFLAIVAPEAADGAALKIFNSSGTLQSSHTFSQVAGAVSGTPCALYLVSSTAGNDGVDGSYFDNPLSHTLPAGTRIVSDYPAFIVWEDENPDEDESILYGHGSFADPISGSAVNLVAKLTGVAATGAVEAVSIGGFEVDVSEVLGSVAATGAIGTVKPNVTEIISGVSATGQIGTVEDKPTEILTGVAGTGAVGTVTISNTVTLSGVAATGSIGTVEDKVTEILTGVSATGAIGTFTIANTVGLSGVAGTTNTPAVEAQITEKISGVAGTTALGDVTLLGADTDVPVVGVAATGAIGTISANVGAGLTGVAATGAIGTVAPNTTFAISVSVSATGAVNTVTANTGATLTGVVGTGAVASVTAGTGTLEVDVLESLTGVSAAGAVAGVEVKVTEILTGVAGTGQVGSLSVGVGAGLTGVEATGQVAELEVGTGTLEVDIVEILASVGATTSVGTVKPNVTEVLSTNLLTGSIGTLSTTAVQFDFEAVKDAYDRSRTVYITGFTESSKDRRVYVQRETRKIYVERFSTAAERRVRTSKAA